MNITVRGTVVSGTAVARLAGFPTANIEPLEKITIPEGIYLGYAFVDEQTPVIPALIFWGRPHRIPRVTEPRCEAHLFGFDGDLYGKEISLELARFIRPNEKFSSHEELACAIHADYAAAKKYFTARPLNPKP